MLDIRCCQLEIFTMQNKRSKIREWKVQGISRIFLKNLIFSPRKNQESVSEKSKEIIKESASTRWYLQNSLCRKFAKEKQKQAAERMTTKKTKSGTHPPPTQTRDAANRQQAAENQQKKRTSITMSGEDVPSHSAKKADAQHSVAESRDQVETETQSSRIRIDTHQPTFAHRNNEKSERPQSERVENANNNEARKKRSLPSGKHGANH